MSADNQGNLRSVQVCSSKHESDIFALCVTDSCYICEDCFERSHRAHSIEYLKFLARDHLRVASALETTVARAIYTCDQQMQTYSRKRLSERITRTVTEFFDSLARALQQTCVAVIQDLHSAAEEEFAGLDRAHKDLGLAKDQLIVLLGSIKQQIKAYENEIQSDRHKWFHEHYTRLCSYEDQTNVLRKNVAAGAERLARSFPDVVPRLGVKEVLQSIERNFEMNLGAGVEETKTSTEPEAPLSVAGTRSLFRLEKCAKPQTPSKNSPSRSHPPSKTTRSKTPPTVLTRNRNSASKSTSTLKKPSRAATSRGSAVCSNHGSVLLPPNVNSDPAGKPCVCVDLFKNHISSRGGAEIGSTASPARSKSATPARRRLPAPSAASMIFVDGPSGTLYRMEVPARKITSMKLRRPVPEGYAAVEARGKVFLAGGELNGVIISDTMEIDMRTAKIQTKAPMTLHRRNHGLLLIRNNAYAIGGYNKSSNILARCEKYNLSTDSWATIPSLNKERNFAACCVFSGRYLYVFGGSATEAAAGLESYEWLDAELLGSWSWRELIKGSREEMNVGHGGGCVQVDKESIMIFGGLDESRYFDYSAVFSVSTGMMIATSATLGKKDAFYQRTPAVVDGKIFCVGFLTRSLHVYDIPEQKWSVVPVFSAK